MENEVLQTEQVEDVAEQEAEQLDAVDPPEIEQETTEVGEQAEVAAVEQAEPEPQKTPTWITDLRRQNREMKRQLQAMQSTHAAAVSQLGEEPALEDCDWDSELFKKKHKAWVLQEQQIENQRKEQAQHAERLQQTWQEKVSGYEAKKANARAAAPDYDDAEEVCKDVLSNVQQVIIVKNARDPARLVLEIGRNPEFAAKLGGITDPVEFTYQIATLEATMATKSPVKSTPAPDKPLRASGGVSNSLGGGAKLEDLKEKAHKTGDWDAYFSAKRAAKK